MPGNHPPPVVTNAGTTAYGYVFGAKNGTLGFCSFDIDNPQTITVLKRNYSEIAVSAGEYVDGKIYTYCVEFGDISEIYPNSFKVYDGETFAEIKSFDTASGNRVVDMTYDYTTNTMYALVENTKRDGTLGPTSLCAVDLETGANRVIGEIGDIRAIDGYNHEVEDNLVTLACDGNGKLYAMSAFRYLYNIDKFTGAATQAAPQHNLGTASQFQSMAFASDGKLWWAQCHPSYGHFCEIDLTTGIPGGFVDFNTDYEKLNKLGDDTQVTALYFRDKEINKSAPLAVTGLTAKVDDADVHSVILNWVLPTADYSGAAPALTGVNVYRIGKSEPIATLGADAITYTDPEAPDGVTTYEVIPFNATGNGFPAFCEVFAGCDQLDKVTDIALTLDGRTTSLSWKAPTATVNGGYADFNAITYNVYRVFAGTPTLVKENVAETTFSETVEEDGTFCYAIEPVSGGVKGVQAQSESFMLTSPAKVPYFTSFEEDGDASQWVIANSTTYGWSMAKGASYTFEGKSHAKATTGGSTALGDDWLFSPEIVMSAGSYTLDFWCRGSGIKEDQFSFDVLLGTDKDDLSTFNTTLYSVKDAVYEIYNEDDTEHKKYVNIKVDFSVPESGNYRIGIHNVTTSTYATMRIDNLAISGKSASVSSIAGDDGEQTVISVKGGVMTVAAAMPIESVRVIDVQGREMKRMAASASDSVLTFGTDELPHGICVVVVTLSDGTSSMAKIAL